MSGDEDPESQISNRVDSETYRKKRKKKPQTAQKLAQIKQEQVMILKNEYGIISFLNCDEYLGYLFKYNNLTLYNNI